MNITPTQRRKQHTKVRYCEEHVVSNAHNGDKAIQKVTLTICIILLQTTIPTEELPASVGVIFIQL